MEDLQTNNLKILHLNLYIFVSVSCEVVTFLLLQIHTLSLGVQRTAIKTIFPQIFCNNVELFNFDEFIRLQLLEPDLRVGVLVLTLVLLPLLVLRHVLLIQLWKMNKDVVSVRTKELQEKYLGPVCCCLAPRRSRC